MAKELENPVLVEEEELDSRIRCRNGLWTGCVPT